MRIKLGPLLLLCFFLSGCAAKKLIVQNADFFLSREVSKRLPLSSDQKDKLAQEVDQFLEKSKPQAQELIPLIAKISFAHTEKFPSIYEELLGHYQKLADDFTGIISRHLASLTKDGQGAFFNILEDEDQKLSDIKKDKQIEKVAERFDRFLGSVNAPQKQLIQEYGDYFENRAQKRLERRKRLQLKFREIFQSGNDLESKSRSFQEAFKKYQVESFEGNKNLEILQRILPTLTPDQKEHFLKHLEDLKEMLKIYLSTEY